MELAPRKPSGREKDEAAVVHLAQLRAKLHAKDISVARKAAFGLSWMQEDGFDILVEALLGSFPRTTKKAATYGLRRMNGRMHKMATAVLTQGLTHTNRITQEACAKALMLMSQGPAAAKAMFRKKRGPRGPQIREFRSKARPRNGAPSRNSSAGR
jgi:hypothetical protein